MQAAQSPESVALKVAMEDVGKMSILRGKLSDKEEQSTKANCSKE